MGQLKIALHSMTLISVVLATCGCEIPSKYPSPNASRDPLASGRGQTQGDAYFVLFPSEKERLIRQINGLKGRVMVEDAIALLGTPDNDYEDYPKDFSRGPYGRSITYKFVEQKSGLVTERYTYVTLMFNAEGGLSKILTNVDEIHSPFR